MVIATSAVTATATEKRVWPKDSENPGTQHAELISRTHQIPRFVDRYEERQWAKEHMAGAFRILAKFQWNDGAGGHISMRDPVQRNCFWISKSRIQYVIARLGC